MKIKKLFSKSKLKELNDLSLKFNSDIDNIKKKIEDKQDHKSLYQETKNSFISGVKALFDIDSYVTEKEIIEVMSKSNIRSETIRKLREITESMNEMEYSSYGFNKDRFYGFIEDCKLLFSDVHSQRMADIISKEDKLLRLKKEIILDRFKSQLGKIKKSYDGKNEIPAELVVKATEYYDKLDNSDKEELSKDYHYYCVNLYHLLILLDDLKNNKKENIEDNHSLISKINKIFFKLKDKERKEIYPKLIKLIDSEEERLNLYFFGGYEFIHENDFENAFSLHSLMLESYGNLEESKKPFYNEMISRYLVNIRDSLLKKIEKDKNKAEQKTEA